MSLFFQWPKKRPVIYYYWQVGWYKEGEKRKKGRGEWKEYIRRKKRRGKEITVNERKRSNWNSQERHGTCFVRQKLKDTHSKKWVQALEKEHLLPVTGNTYASLKEMETIGKGGLTPTKVVAHCSDIGPVFLLLFQISNLNILQIFLFCSFVSRSLYFLN